MCFTSCISNKAALNTLNARVNFEKSDFELTEIKTSKASSVRFLYIDWVAIFSKKYGSFSSSIVSTVPFTDKTANKAIGKMIEENPGYNVVFYPTTKTETTNILGIIKYTNATVSAQLGRLKR